MVSLDPNACVSPSPTVLPEVVVAEGSLSMPMLLLSTPPPLLLLVDTALIDVMPNRCCC